MSPHFESQSGRLLVAAPSLGDPNFRHTVIFLVEHTEEGAAGVVLNRRSDVAVADTLPTWVDLVAPPPLVFAGGPVQPDGVLALGRLAADGASVSEATTEVIPGIGVVDLDADPLGSGLVAVRIFAGYAGWGAGQLESELAEGGWFTVAAEPDDAFCSQPDGLWRAVLARQGGLFTTVADDPSLN